MTPDEFYEKFELFAEAPDAVGKMRELVLGLGLNGQLIETDHSKWQTIFLGEFSRLRRGYDLPRQNRRKGEIPIFASNGPIGFHEQKAVDGPGVITGRSGSIGKVHYTKDDFWPLNTALYVEDFFGNDPEFTCLLLRGLRLERFSSSTAVATLNRNVVHKELVTVPPLAEQKRIVAKVDELMALCDELETRQAEREQQKAALHRAALHRFHQSPTPANLNLLFREGAEVDPAAIRTTVLQLAVRGKLTSHDPNDKPAKQLLEEISESVVSKSKSKKTEMETSHEVKSPPFTLPKSWSWATFQQVANIASNLVKPDKYLDSIHLAPDNIEKGNGVLLPCVTIQEAKVKSSKHRFFPGQIVYSKIRPNLSKVVIVDFEGLCSADMYPIDAQIDSAFLLKYMLSDVFLAQAVKTDTRVAMPKINQTELKAIAVPVPPLPEQKRIVAKVDQLMALVDELEAQQTRSDALARDLLDALVAELTAAGAPDPVDS